MTELANGKIETPPAEEQVKPENTEGPQADASGLINPSPTLLRADRSHAFRKCLHRIGSRSDV